MNDKKENNYKMNHKEYAEKLFEKDVFATETTGAKIEIAEPGYVKCSLQIERKHLNIRGAVMGGAIFTLADFAFGAAANLEGMGSVTLSCSINFLRPGTGPVLYAEARSIKNGKSINFYEVTITDSDGKIVATMMANGFNTSPVPLD